MLAVKQPSAGVPARNSLHVPRPLLPGHHLSGQQATAAESHENILRSTAAAF